MEESESLEEAAETSTEQSDEQFEESLLPLITDWIPHDISHNGWYSDNRGHYCSTINCEINKNPRSLIPILIYLQNRKGAK